jgi:flagellar hook assembly protein FlgD
LTSVYPNPFNPATSINYNVNKFSKVNINIYDVTGKLVSILENSYKPVGNHSIVWEASSLPSGVYFVNLSINSHTETIKIMLTK